MSDLDYDALRAKVLADDVNPYARKTIDEIVHDYAVVRGDLVEQYARDQLVRIIEDRIARTALDLAQRAEADRAALHREVVSADHCHGLVVRDGWEDACGKPPVAIIDARDVEDGCYWPACAYHAHRYGRGKCVPLADIRAALEREEDQ